MSETKKSSEEMLRQKLGSYTAPVGLYDKTKSLPFLGAVTCNVSQIVAGSWQEVVLRYADDRRGGPDRETR